MTPLDPSYPFQWAYLKSWFSRDNLYDRYTLKRIMEGTRMFTPLNDNIIVEPDSFESWRQKCDWKNSDGLLVANALQKGTVVAVGPGEHSAGVLLPMRLKVGDRVLFIMGAGNCFAYDGGVYLQLDTYDIMGVE